MRKMMRYQINMCVRTCRIQRSNPDGVFLIRRGIVDAEDGALSHTHEKNKQTARNYSLLIFLRF